MLSEKPLSFETIEFLCEKRQDNNWAIIKGKYFSLYKPKPKTKSASRDGVCASV